MSLHCNQTQQNAGMEDRALIARMKRTALLVNTARGGLIHEAELAAALDEGLIAGAAVDVVTAEPIREDNPLLKAKNCLITPHIAWAAKEARIRLMQTTAENVRGYQAGKPINVVNP